MELTEVEQQKAELARAIAFALVTGGSQPYPVPMHEVAKIADLAYRCGVRQTDQVEEQVDLPPFVTEAAREQSITATAEPDLAAPQDTPRVRTAPECPSRIPKKRMGVVIS